MRRITLPQNDETPTSREMPEKVHRYLPANLSGITRTAQRASHDLRALGPAAPIRALYELSKRIGGHKLLFHDTYCPHQHVLSNLRLGSHIPLSNEAQRRCIDDAWKTLNEGTRVFGNRSHTGIQAPWSTDPITAREWERNEPWWKIDIRSTSRMSDVKFVWEVGRHRDLVVFARAAVLDPSGPWLSQLESSLRHWFEECQPEKGVHWQSSLELALRSISWAQIIALVGESLAAQTHENIEHHLIASARHIIIELPYTLSSMRNNHLLGDGLGLVMIGHLLPRHPNSRHWTRLGDYLMLTQLKRHLLPDGAMIEDSLSYHRFVLEMLIIRHLLGDCPEGVTRAMESSALHLVQMGVMEGPIPQYGDWDEGRVLADSSPPGSVLGSVLLALALSGYGIDPLAWSRHDELAWYTPPLHPRKELPSDGQAVARAGYFFRARRGDYRVWLKASGGRSHQHSDVTALWISQEDVWVIEDPGTGTYNGPLAVRNGFRASAAHDVWRPLGQDQLRPHRAFRWLHSAHGQSAAPLCIGEVTVLLATHDAFRADTPQARVARLVVLTPRGVTVLDHVEQSGVGNWQLTIPLGVEANIDDFFGVDDAILHRAVEQPFAGWRSPTYGQWEPARWASLERDLSRPVVWGIGERYPDILSTEVTWKPSGVHVEITVAGETYHLEATDD